MKVRVCVGLIFALLSGASFSCDITLNPGTNVVAPAVSSASTGDEICLNSGTYTESSTVGLKQGQTLRGLGTNITDTVIWSTATYIVNFSSGATLKHLAVEGKHTYVAPNYFWPDLGLVINGDPNAIVWDVSVSHAGVPIHITSSDGTALWNVFVSTPDPKVTAGPNPNVWIYDSDNVEILYGSYTGQSNGVGGDGEIACRDSNYLEISNVYMNSSGAAGMYFVNCDNATVQDSTITAGDEWGLDVVDGSSNFTATGNTISYNYWGAVIFDETDNGSGTFTNNTFTGNNTSSSVNCQGIVVMGNVNNVSQSSNTASPSPAICAY